MPLLPSSSAKISFTNTSQISKTTFHFTAKISIALCWPKYLETLKVFSLHFYTWRQTCAGYLKKISLKNFPQPQEFGVRLVTVTNEPVPKPSRTFFAFSRATHFPLSTSWKCRRVPIWLKTSNPKRYAAEYWYRKGLKVYAHSRNGNEPNARNKNLFRQKRMQRC